MNIVVKPVKVRLVGNDGGCGILWLAALQPFLWTWVYVRHSEACPRDALIESEKRRIIRVSPQNSSGTSTFTGARSDVSTTPSAPTTSMRNVVALSFRIFVLPSRSAIPVTGITTSVALEASAYQ